MQYLQCIILFLFTVNKGYAELRTTFESTPDYDAVYKWVTAKLEIKQAAIMSHVEQIEENVNKYVQWIEGVDANGAKTKCYVQACYTITDSALTVKDHHCKAPNPEPDHGKIIEWLSSQLKKKVTQIINHVENQFTDKVLHAIEVQVEDKKCMVIVEYLKTEETNHIKIYNCEIENKLVDFKKILQLISAKLNAVYSMEILTHVEVFFKESTIYTLQIDGYNTTNGRETCSVVIECYKANDNCKAISKHCNPIENHIVDYELMLKWISKQLALKLANVVTKEIKSDSTKIIYRLEFEAKDAKDSKMLCTATVQFEYSANHFQLVTKNCKVIEVFDNYVPEYEKVLKWTASTINVQVVNIIKHLEQTQKDKIVYTFQFMTHQESCYAVVHYLKVSKSFILKFQMCGMTEVDANYPIVADLLIQKIELMNCKIVTHVEVSLVDRTVFTVQLQGADVSEKQQFCFVVVECIRTSKECTLEASQCSLHGTTDAYKMVLKWFANKYNIKIKKIIHQDQDVVDDKIIHKLNLEIVNGTNVNQICDIIAYQFVHHTQIELHSMQCGANNNYAPDFKYVVQLLTENVKITNTQISHHTLNVMSDKVVYNVWIKTVSGECCITVDYLTSESNFYISKNNCTTLEPVAQIPKYGEIVKWVANKIKVEIDKIYAHREITIEGGIQYGISFMTGRRSCYVLVYFLHEGRRLYLMSNFCFEMCCLDATLSKTTSITVNHTLSLTSESSHKCKVIPVKLYNKQ